MRREDELLTDRELERISLRLITAVYYSVCVLLSRKTKTSSMLPSDDLCVYMYETVYHMYVEKDV